MTALLALLLAAAAAAADVPVVENPAEPPVVETWRLREVWRLDDEEDPDLPLLGMILGAAVDDRGHVLLLDAKFAHVLDIAPDGRCVATLGREGDGPGELRMPAAVFLTGAGEVGLVQPFPGRIVLLDRAGLPAGTIPGRGTVSMLLAASAAAGNLVVSGTEGTVDGGELVMRSFLSAVTREGDRPVTYVAVESRRSLTAAMDAGDGPWFLGGAWTQAPDGSVLAAAARDAYRIDWYEPDGALRRVIARAFTPCRLTDAEKEERAALVSRGGRRPEGAPRPRIPDTDPALAELQCLADGTLWVQSCRAERGLPDGVCRRYDVFDAEGRLRREVRLVWTLDPARDLLLLLADGRFVWLRGMQDALHAQMAGLAGSARADDDRDSEDTALQVVLLERAD